MHKILQPPNWPRPKGYSNGILAAGKTIYTGGIIGWNEQEVIESNRLADQV
jgi:enamine deaminase RidA (YjgF/YER057c/UK114 family)